MYLPRSLIRRSAPRGCPAGAATEAEQGEGEEEGEQRDRKRKAAEAVAAQHSELFCALCTKQRQLLRPLMVAYAQVNTLHVSNAYTLCYFTSGPIKQQHCVPALTAAPAGCAPCFG